MTLSCIYFFIANNHLLFTEKLTHYLTHSEKKRHNIIKSNGGIVYIQCLRNTVLIDK